jgi:hypothetical protein
MKYPGLITSDEFSCRGAITWSVVVQIMVMLLTCLREGKKKVSAQELCDSSIPVFLLSDGKEYVSLENGLRLHNERKYYLKERVPFNKQTAERIGVQDESRNYCTMDAVLRWFSVAPDSFFTVTQVKLKDSHLSYKVGLTEEGQREAKKYEQLVKQVRQLPDRAETVDGRAPVRYLQQVNHGLLRTYALPSPGSPHALTGSRELQAFHLNPSALEFRPAGHVPVQPDSMIMENGTPRLEQQRLTAPVEDLHPRSLEGYPRCGLINLRWGADVAEWLDEHTLRHLIEPLQPALPLDLAARTWALRCASPADAAVCCAKLTEYGFTAIDL